MVKVKVVDKDKRDDLQNINAGIDTLKKDVFDPLTNNQKFEELRKALRAALRIIKKELK